MRFSFKKDHMHFAWATACLLASTTIPARAAVPTLSDHLPAAVSQHLAQRLGDADPAQRLNLAIALPLHNQAGLDALLRDLYDPASPQYKHYLSVAQFAGRFGPSQSDYDTAVQFFASQSLAITGTAANRYIVDVEGSIADIERVLHITIGIYRHPTEARDFYAPDQQPSLDLAVPVLHISGLDNYVIPTPRFVRPNAQRHLDGPGGSGPEGYYLGSDLRKAYDGSSTLTGTGQSVGLMELGPFAIADVQTYFTTFGPPLTTAVNAISTDGSVTACTGICGDVEQALDIEFAIAMAPGLKAVNVYVAKTAESVLNRMASANVDKQLSTSWGWKMEFGVDDNLFKEFAAQGQTFLTASGDLGSLASSGPWPEEDANLTAVGATNLLTKSRGGPWKSETAWIGSCGGPSLDSAIKIKPYQLPFINATNGGSPTLRNVPDIAAEGGNANYICAEGTCSGGWAGTSFASPTWAGLIALLNQSNAAQGKPPAGFLNPSLYQMAGTTRYPHDLHDITNGTNLYFNATPGYDLVTGLGTPIGLGLAKLFTRAPATQYVPQ